MSNPYNAHGMNPVARAAHSHAHSTAVKMSHQFAAQSMRGHKMAIATHKRMAANARKAAARGQRNLRRRPQQKLQSKLAMLRKELRKVVGQTFRFSRLVDQEGGQALFLESNWQSRDGIPRLVLACNTQMPGSGRQVAAFLLTETGLEGVDLESESLEHAAKRGRLFIIPASVRFSDDEAYSVRPALSCQQDGGVPGIWSYPTVGLHEGRLFAVGPGRIGSFADRSERGLVAFRPVTWNEKAEDWVWVGRSEASEGARLKFKVDDPFSGPGAEAVFVSLPRNGPGDTLSAVKCSLRDDWGDPFGVIRVGAAPAFGIRMVGGRPHFYGSPNLSHPKEGPVFAHRASVGSDGKPALVVPFQIDGEDIDVELPANHREQDGSYWFVRRANAIDPSTGRPLALVPLSQS